MIRRIPFAGALNFRDIGGYRTSGGGRTRAGTVYRSDSLHYLTPDDLPAFDALGIKAIYDLRRADELRQRPGPREHLHLELPNRNPVGEATYAQLRTRLDGEQWLLADYLGMLADAAPVFGDLFLRLADSGRLPAVIHCLGGKDRTGLAVALLLTALGAERESVLDDYQLTNDCRGVAHMPDVVEFFVESGIARAAAEGILSAPRWTMAKALGRSAATATLLPASPEAAGKMGPCGMSRAALNALKTVLIV